LPVQEDNQRGPQRLHLAKEVPDRCYLYSIACIRQLGYHDFPLHLSCREGSERSRIVMRDLHDSGGCECPVLTKGESYLVGVNVNFGCAGLKYQFEVSGIEFGKCEICCLKVPVVARRLESCPAEL